MSVERRREKIDPKHKRLSVVQQCALLQISRSGHYYRPTGESEDALALMRLIDEAFLESPYYGARQMMRHLHRLGHRIGRHRVARLMRKMGLRAIYQKPNTSAPHPEHRIYPYLLRDLAVVRPNQVWCSDITYIPMRRGFLYLIEALEEALARYGKPEIFNTDQGSQFTSVAFTQVLKDACVQISMDGKGRWIDNVFIERLWRSMKYECVYLHAFETGSALHAGLLGWISHYNKRRPHSALAGRTPDEAYHQIRLPSPSPGHATAMVMAANMKLAA